MSGTSSVSGGTLGSNVPPVSFPGISSGIDYNSIIEKLTSLTLQPATQLETQVATLNSANAELIKINGLLASVQASLTALSDPSIYAAYDAVSGNTAVATASAFTTVAAIPGTYLIDSTQLATATQVVSSFSAGHSENDVLGGGTGSSAPLANSYAAITPTNGGSGSGSITVDGVTVNYDVTTQSLTTILANINAAVAASGDSTFNIGFVAGTDTIQVTDSAHPVVLGSSSDKGNLLQVLRLDQAQVQNTASSGSVTGTAGVGGINAAQSFNAPNSTYTTPVTAGTFTINGVSISVAQGQNMYDVLTAINQSSAGVTASYDAGTGAITLANKNTGPQNIVLGSSSDTSNFLQAAGLTAASGATQTVGTQASVTFQNSSGATKTVYSNSNAVTNAIPGVEIDLKSNDATSPFTISVASSGSSLTQAVNTFVSAYNAAVSEIDTATAAPVVVQGAAGSGSSAQSVGGGILYNNGDVQSIQQQLVSIVSGLLGTNSQYNALSAVGLQLTSSFAQLTASGSTSSSSPVSVQQQSGTDGQLQPLNAAALSAALAANPSAVAQLFNGPGGLVNQLGSYLTTVTGSPTLTTNSIVGSIPSVSLMQGFENGIQSQVSSLQTQIQQIQDNANQQADQLRQEFVASETAISGYQSMMQQVDAYFGVSSSSSSSSGGL